MWGALVNHSPKDNLDTEHRSHVVPLDRHLKLAGWDFELACLIKMNMNSLPWIHLHVNIISLHVFIKSHIIPIVNVL